MGTTTRQAINDFKAHLRDDEISVIPNEIMKLVLDVNTDYQERLASSQERMALAMERMATVMERNAMSTDTQVQLTRDVLEKLDTLNTTINGGTTILADAQKNADRAGVEADLEVLLKKKHTTEWKLLRSKELSRYYRELLQMDNKFVPEKYRTKVAKHQVTRENIKQIHIEQSIHNVETEIRIMETNVNEWNMELQTIATDTNSKLAVLNEQKQNEFKTRIQESEQKNLDSWQVAFAKITKQYEDEMNSGADQFLFKFHEDKTQDTGATKDLPRDSKNAQSRGGHHASRGSKRNNNFNNNNNNSNNNKQKK